MKRRSFIKKTGLATAGAFMAPYILPSGRLFAATGARKANHVVFCLFAGGVRNWESVQKRDGNLMPNTLNGNESISIDIASAMDTLPSSPLAQPLQNYGTLFKEFRYSFGPTGHFNGHTTALTGVYTANDINIKENPKYPTIFEYYRKHNSPSMSALNAWWVSNALGPYPSLNFSSFSGYGAQYGANYIQPLSIISQEGLNALGDPKIFSSAELDLVKNVRGFCDNNFGKDFVNGDAGITNTDADAVLIENFISRSFNEAVAGNYANPWGAGAAMNSDMLNVFFAEKVIEEFQPELLVVNMQDVDIAHSNFTESCNNLRKADFAVAHLWDTIQNTPGMKDDTVLIVVPEHGRNQEPNTLIDAYGRYATDHTGDDLSRSIFCLVVGPPGVVNQGKEVTAVEGESIDVVPTIADILGFLPDINSGVLSGSPLQQAFL